MINGLWKKASDSILSIPDKTIISSLLGKQHNNEQSIDSKELSPNEVTKLTDQIVKKLSLVLS